MKKGFSTATAATVLAGLWLSLFIVALSIPCFLALRKAIESDTLTAGLEKLSGIYAPYIGAIFAYFFVARTAQAAERVTSGAAVAIAALVSIIWNLVVIGLLAQAPFGWADAEEAFKLAGDVSSKLSWLVAPMIGFFFAKSESPPRPESDQQGGAPAMGASHQ